MPQITNLRLLFSSAANHPNPSSFLSSFKPNSFFKFNTKIPTKLNKSISFSYPFFTCLSSSSSSSSSSSRKSHRYNSKSFNSNRRISSSNSKQSDMREKRGLSSMKMGDEVEETKKMDMAAGFNKKRAEGRDKSSRPKDLKLKVRRLNPVNTISYVQVLGTGMDTQDTSPSVLLFFDKQRFIFNAGEGLQRFCTEHKIKLSKIDHIFLSRVCSETAGGLPGLLLTLAGTGEEGISVNVWGPSDFKYLVDAMKSFIPNAAMVHTRCFGPSPKSDKIPLDNLEKLNDQLKLIDDEVVKISAILLRPSSSETNGLKKDEFALKSSDISVLYICELPEIRGKFDPEKARALGLRPGPKYRELQEGVSVKSDTKNIMVHPDDVLGPSVPGPIVLLVDCPTLSHFQELLSSSSLETYYADVASMPDENHKTVNCVIHLSPALVGTGLKLCETISAENLLKFFIRFYLLEQFHLRPYAQLGLDRSGIPATAASHAIIEELLSEIPEISDAAQQVARLWQKNVDAREAASDENMIEEPWLNQNYLPSCLEGITRENVEIVLLGTGSSQPSKYRNVSSVFINLFSKGADDAVKGLRFIWISHIHADHHTGLARILALRRDLLKGVPHEPLVVIGPRQLKRFLDAYERLEELDMQFLDCRHTTKASLAAFESNYNQSDNSEPLNGNKIDSINPKVSDSSLFSKGSQMQSHWKRPGSPVDGNLAYPIIKNLTDVLNEAGLESVISFPVVHCPQAFGVVLKGVDRLHGDGRRIVPGWKIVYSGDTRPCPELVEASRGATEAIARNHSTTKEAIEVGDAAGAYRIILTHFSQRYPKIPVFDEGHMHKTCIAFDMMSINFADLHVLPRVLPYLKLLFKNEMVVDEYEDLEDVVTLAA
ncbi:hypothetical protein Ccrd_015703 [Cynara cardunculus var. scolymus]|uniref:ribonuclease Z n=1 Tax=Cynara cardunculus var. scolymus TaxID=59895 RepID=A0A103YBC8_CYNCS|nr:hypothetical protein Ccrd_015703 [Cynara cardunculus var. scolymus]